MRGRRRVLINMDMLYINEPPGSWEGWNMAGRIVHVR